VSGRVDSRNNPSIVLARRARLIYLMRCPDYRPASRMGRSYEQPVLDDLARQRCGFRVDFGRLAMPFLYAARRLVHDLSTRSAAWRGGLEAGARAGSSPRRGTEERNKAVLLAHGREEVGQHIEREFERISALVTRDSGRLPALQRKLLEESRASRRTTRNAGRCRRRRPNGSRPSRPSPKSSPSTRWFNAYSRDQALGACDPRQGAGRVPPRLRVRATKILNGFMPFWRSLDKTFGQVDQKLTGLHQTSSKIDAQMEKYEQINKKTDKAEHALTVSAFTHLQYRRWFC